MTKDHTCDYCKRSQEFEEFKWRQQAIQLIKETYPKYEGVIFGLDVKDMDRETLLHALSATYQHGSLFLKPREK